MIIFQLASSNW